jgi:hypothetical protein
MFGVMLLRPPPNLNIASALESRPEKPIGTGAVLASVYNVTPPWNREGSDRTGLNLPNWDLLGVEC